ncbi:hypothetical protein J3Q64DRAFT_1769183 [Phycomyces blakesleeanus]|uniref:DUF2470 domain-containing protein n=2 Tax=Phycomyces blakesleeanus TaxID=4837 RepID=A0A163A1I9_PHYB8|nr:hypothetical protein PHYBLDRAFT_148357 [Phycomyces blakesleeanus NRRL 1555(-)]OAD70441.1 hypothetical protein PHYBLDRAFT_148357 [Phycomyces blakesleeanus NRRL 1555(-)]|eukprot:XP_018288481.1 hypothetical protein PHYBLDRAFT_148357 [Phycomyces blakesleeanus NRRL 1555(-)]
MAPDLIAPHSAPISAYMSVHSATNLAYVRYFGRQDSAVSATFKSLNSRTFTVEYILGDGTRGESVIPFPHLLTRREEIRPVLESMAKEAESALGLPSSLSGPPPLNAIAKAMYAQATNMYTPEEPAAPLDVFYNADPFWQMMIAAGLGLLFLYRYAPDTYIRQHFPQALIQFRNYLGPKMIDNIWRTTVLVHVFESFATMVTCIRRKWYSPINIAKWTASSFIFGVASMNKLVQHGKEVRHGMKYE